MPPTRTHLVVLFVSSLSTFADESLRDGNNLFRTNPNWLIHTLAHRTPKTRIWGNHTKTCTWSNHAKTRVWSNHTECVYKVAVRKTDAVTDTQSRVNLLEVTVVSKRCPQRSCRTVVSRRCHAQKLRELTLYSYLPHKMKRLGRLILIKKLVWDQS